MKLLYVYYIEINDCTVPAEVHYSVVRGYQVRLISEAGNVLCQTRWHHSPYLAEYAASGLAHELRLVGYGAPVDEAKSDVGGGG